MFYCLATKPDFWKERINLFVSLAPVVNIDFSESPQLKAMARAGNLIERGLERNGLYELFGKGWEQDYGYVKKLFPLARAIANRVELIDPEMDD